MQIDIWSDTVCPWCYVGLKRLQQALAQRPQLLPRLRFLPFELNPDLPEAGMDRREYLRMRFGDPDPFRHMLGRMQALAADLGIDYRPELQTRMPNTRRSHLLIAGAAAADRQLQVKEAVLRAYFSDGRDIGDPAVLREIGTAAGLDAALVDRSLADPDLRAAVVQQEETAQRMQVTGVPTFVFDRKLGFSGAQELPVFLQALDRVQTEALKSGTQC